MQIIFIADYGANPLYLPLAFFAKSVIIKLIMAKIKFTIITLFPEALRPYLDSSMLYKAQDRGIIEIEYVNLRDFGLGPHKSVDDTPYGGGDGMLLRCEPIFAAIESVKTPFSKVIVPTPVGETWNQSLARKFAGLEEQNTPQTSLNALEASIMQKCDDTALTAKTAAEGESAPEDPRHYIILCPHYEGYDERIMSIVDYKISLGNYVLTGGELAALIIIDSVTRLLPGVLGGNTSAEIESFSDGDNLEFPQYTKPAEFRGMKVPEVLLSGHHGKVAEWRQRHSGRKTD